MNMNGYYNYNSNYGGVGGYHNYMQYQQPQPQQIMFPLFIISGIEGAKAHIVGLNQTVYLKDNDSNIIYIKSANAQGQITLKALDTREIPLEDVGKTNNQTKVPAININDLNALENKIMSKLDDLFNSKKSGEVVNE